MVACMNLLGNVCKLPKRRSIIYSNNDIGIYGFLTTFMVAYNFRDLGAFRVF